MGRMTTPRDLSRLAQAVKRRRLELGLARLTAAQSAGISKDTWQKVEEGQPVREVSYAKIDAALGWASGSCEMVAGGGAPIPVESANTAEGVDIATVTITTPKNLGDEVRRSVQTASLGTLGHLTADEIRTLSEQVVADLRARGVIE